jgi:hypothetical protein
VCHIAAAQLVGVWWKYLLHVFLQYSLKSPFLTVLQQILHEHEENTLLCK